MERGKTVELEMWHRFLLTKARQALLLFVAAIEAVLGGKYVDRLE